MTTSTKSSQLPHASLLNFNLPSEQSHQDKSSKNQTPFNCSATIESLKCYQCTNFETHNLTHLKHHFITGHSVLYPKEKFYDCENCSHQTNSILLYLKHKSLHVCMRYGKIKSERAKNLGSGQTEADENYGEDWTHNRHQFWRCELCPYLTKFPGDLKRHILVKHTAPDKIQWFRCAQCPYRSKMKFQLKHHVIYDHGNKTYLKCERCPFETKFKHNLKSHILTKHAELKDVPWLKCAQCSYKSKHHGHLKKHVDRIHGVKECLKCDRCTFETKYKNSLKSHILWIHTEPKKIQWFECGHCTYKSKTKSNLTKHMDRMHGDKKSFEMK